jgi:hypothetical protein
MNEAGLNSVQKKALNPGRAFKAYEVLKQHVAFKKIVLRSR